MRRTPFLTALVVAVALPAAGDETPTGPFAEVAETDDRAVGLADGVTYSAIQLPMVDASGTFLFESQLEGDSPLQDVHASALFLGRRGALQVVAHTGDPAPGTGGLLWSNLSGVGQIVRPGGRVAFPGELLGTDTTHDGAIWAGLPASLALVAREGDPAPGTTAVFASGNRYFQDALHLAMNDSGMVALRAKLAGTGVVTNTNDQALFTGTAGALTLAARLGSPAPGAGGATFVRAGTESFTAPGINASGTIVFRGHLTGTGVTPTNADAIWYGMPGALSIALRGDQPASGPGIPANSKFVGVGAEPPIVNDAGQILFESSVFDGLNLTQAVWLGVPGAYSSLAAHGQSAPSDSQAATFAGSFLHLRLNGSGQAAFHATLSSGPSDWGLYGWDGSVLRRLWRAGDAAVGMPAGEMYGSVATEDVFLNSQGKVLFRLTTVPSLILGVWLGDLNTGEVQLVARTGVKASARGKEQDIIDLLLFSGPDTAGSPQDGRCSPLADDGTYAILAQFLDGHLAVLTNGGVSASVPSDPYLVPATVSAKRNAKHPERSALTVSGTFDTGPAAADLTAAAMFDAGGFHLDIPGLEVKGRSLTFSANGVTLTLTPAANGSSNTRFTLKAVGDFAGKVQLDGPLALKFKSALYDATSSVNLAAGKIAPHGLTDPALSVVSASATVKGAGKDKLSLVLRFASDGVIPSAPMDLTIGFGGAFSVTLEPGSFAPKGGALVLQAKTGGISKAIVDYAKGVITISGSGLDLGTFADGAQGVAVTIGFGSDLRTAGIRMTKSGSKLAY